MEEIRFNGISSDNGILNGLSFAIKNNDVVAISGDETAEEIGKIITGFSNIELGSLEILGKVVEKNTSHNEIVKIQNKIGFLFDNPAEFLKNKTVAKEVEYGLKFLGFKNISYRVIESLKKVGLNNDYLQKDPSKLSTSEQKKVLLAAILAIEPEIFVLNNPDKGMDLNFQTMLKRMILDLNKKGKQIIIITNNTNFYFDIATRIMIFKESKLIEDGNNEIFYNKNIKKLVDIPNLISFILNSNKKLKTDLYPTCDIKDLMKDIYRIKKAAER